MKIGVYFTSVKHTGGVYQYSLAILETLASIKGNTYTIFTTSPDIPVEFYKKSSFEIVTLVSGARSFVEKTRGIVSAIANIVFPKFIPFLYRNKLFWLISLPDKLSHKGLVKIIDSAGLDLIIYPSSSNLSFLAHTPAIVAIHDLAHRLYPHFPEVSAGGRWELREYNFSKMCEKATLILVDSQVGKEDVLNCYPSTNSSKIVTLPFLPPSYLKQNMSKTGIESTLKKYRIMTPYFYYPANFWPHKHHLDLLEALRICHVKQHKFHLVFTGSKDAEFSTYKEMVTRAKKYGLLQYIHYLGYVSARDVSALYQGSTALVMPTNFGPSNIPVLEAWTLGTPVIYSNVRGCKEQLGKAGISIDPENPKLWASAMVKMYEDKVFAQKCIKLGRERLKLWQFKDFSKRIREMLMLS